MTSSAAKKLHDYRSYNRGGAVYGDLAYSLERELPRGQVRQRQAEKAMPKPLAQPKVRAVSHVQLRERQHVSPVAVLGAVSVIAMTILVLMSYIQLMVLSSSVVALKGQLEELEVANVSLTAEYEQMYDLSSIKEAAEAAGMSKPSSSQIFYLDLSEDDNAVVYQQEEPGVLSQLLSSLSHGIYTVVEYFD